MSCFISRQGLTLKDCLYSLSYSLLWKYPSYPIWNNSGLLNISRMTSSIGEPEHKSNSKRLYIIRASGENNPTFYLGFALYKYMV